MLNHFEGWEQETGTRLARRYSPNLGGDIEALPHEGTEGNPQATGGSDYNSLLLQIAQLQAQLSQSQQVGPTIPQFTDTLDQYNPLFFEHAQQISDAANAFAPNRIMQLQRANQKGILEQTSQIFARNNEGNTSAELNALNRAKSGFGLQNIQALQQGAQARAGLFSQSADFLNQGLQNLTIPEQLRISALAAINAGKR